MLVPSGPTEEKLIEALKTGPYGKCVFHCNNNVVDHQVVNLNMTDGTTMSFTMCGFTAETSRYAKFMGTRGEVIVDININKNEKTKIHNISGQITSESLLCTGSRIFETA